jgi:hypothetical protein
MSITAGYQPTYDHGASINAPTYGIAAPVASMPYYSREQLGMTGMGARSPAIAGADEDDDGEIVFEDDGTPISTMPTEGPVTTLPYQPSSWWTKNKKMLAIVIVLLLLILGGGWWYHRSQ